MSSFWFDPMVNTVGMPGNPGPGGNNLAAVQAMNSQLAQQQAYVAAQNQAALYAARPMPPGYGQVNLPYLSGSFGPAARPGTYSSGSGRSSYSGASLGGGGSVFQTGAPAYNSYGGSADQAWYLGGSQGPRPSSGGGIGSDAARAPNQPAIQSNIPWGGYNSPSQYGWMHNEGAPAPAAPQVYNKGQFNPHTYGWDHNEGANSHGGAADQAWYLGGSQGPRPSDSFTKGAPSSGVIGGWYDPYGGGGGYPQQAPAKRAPAPAMSQDWQSTFNNTVNGNNSAAYPLGGSPWYPGGGRDDPRDVQWMLGGSQGPRPSSLGPSSSLVGNAWATGTPAGARQPVPDARTYMPSGQFGGYLDHYLWGAKSGNLGASGIMASPFGGYVPSGGAHGGAADQAWYLGGSQGPRPSSMGGGIGSDALYGGQNTVAGYGAAQNALRGGQGWTIAQQPQAVTQEMLANRINQGIYDIGNAGDYYGRSIGGGFGMNLPNAGQDLTQQDLASPHAYSPSVRGGMAPGQHTPFSRYSR